MFIFGQTFSVQNAHDPLDIFCPEVLGGELCFRIKAGRTPPGPHQPQLRLLELSQDDRPQPLLLQPCAF